MRTVKCRVYASLVNDHLAAMINERLILPKQWVEDKRRCEKAGIPEDQIQNKTKVRRTKANLAHL
ncbi:MAG TPA: hypothetical protein DCP28_36905 [Cytophagales bacterium]|nr:hypothetical protein [Cytophagales bacterium]